MNIYWISRYYSSILNKSNIFQTTIGILIILDWYQLIKGPYYVIFKFYSLFVLAFTSVFLVPRFLSICILLYFVMHFFLRHFGWQTKRYNCSWDKPRKHKYQWKNTKTVSEVCLYLQLNYKDKYCNHTLSCKKCHKKSQLFFKTTKPKQHNLAFKQDFPQEVTCQI